MLGDSHQSLHGQRNRKRAAQSTRFLVSMQGASTIVVKYVLQRSSRQNTTRNICRKAPEPVRLCSTQIYATPKLRGGVGRFLQNSFNHTLAASRITSQRCGYRPPRPSGQTPPIFPPSANQNSFQQCGALLAQVDASIGPFHLSHKTSVMITLAELQRHRCRS